ncbi:hypothetical protein P7K49_006285 [Saguinus oedipus]|uniref:Uncharacterized protein n=1 Tax=Saguinus oedipus TaxID=9490 RepID=A0ABQ9W3L6_SAGOE|nr:hypothetical protein P7K49_006285 [Saguinus oedipus]
MWETRTPRGTPGHRGAGPAAAGQEVARAAATQHLQSLLAAELLTGRREVHSHLVFL